MPKLFIFHQGRFILGTVTYDLKPKQQEKKGLKRSALHMFSFFLGQSLKHENHQNEAGSEN